jgi:WD40 repeat protein
VLLLWDLAAKKQLATLQAHKGFSRCLAFSPDGKLLASGGRTSPDTRPGDPLGEVVIYDVASRKEVARWAAHGYPVLALAFSPDGKQLVTCGIDEEKRRPGKDLGDNYGGVKVWDLSPGK